MNRLEGWHQAGPYLALYPRALRAKAHHVYLVRRFSHRIRQIVLHGLGGLGRWLYGSVADEVLRRVPVPVLLVSAVCTQIWAEDQPLRVTDEHLTAALDQLLDTSNELTRLLLGSQAPHTPQHQPG